MLITLMYQIRVLNSIINQITIFGKRVGVSECAIHLFDCFCIFLLELRIKKVNYLLDSLVGDYCFYWTTSKVSSTLWAGLSVLVFVEILVYAALAERV